MQEKNTGFAGWFSSLFGRRKADSEPTEPLVDLSETDQLQGVTETDKELSTLLVPCEARLPPTGFFWKLWDYYQSQSPKPAVAAPQFCLNELSQDMELPLSRKELELEKIRLGSFLEQRAKERMYCLTNPATENDSAPSLPAQCWIYLSKNGLMAWGFPIPPIGAGAPLSLDVLTESMGKAKVTVGVQPSIYRTLLSDTSYFRLFPLALGIPPIPGVNGSVIEHYPRQHVGTLQADEKGNLDYRSNQYVQNIRKGTVICDITLPTQGTDGVKVDGQVVTPPPALAAFIPKGRNTDLSQDGLQLIATMDGHLQFSGNVFQIKPVLEIPGDVDYSTGNIDYHGDVHIAGDVRENFFVRATGTVTIGGLVEAATVEAEGDIVVAKGVLGDNKALLKSKKSVCAKYLEYCVVYSGKDTVADCILDSQIYSDSSIRVTTGRGTVIGGCLTAAYQIEAENIGSQSGKKTELILGALPCVQQEYQDNERNLDVIKSELVELQRKLVPLEEAPPDPSNAKDLGQYRLRKSVLALKQDGLKKRQVELQALQSDLTKCRLLCRALYPPTQLTIGTASLSIGQTWHRMTAIYDPENYEIKFL